MTPPAPASEESAFVKDFCVPFLLSVQNEDGGWGFHPLAESRCEPTCWALRALGNVPVEVPPERLARGREHLLRAQLTDGSWPTSSEERTGSWVTSLVSNVLSDQKEAETAVRAALRWLCEDFPRDSGLLMRLLRRFRKSPGNSEQDDSVRGWGWTPHTSSWVEPTAQALLALTESPVEWRPPSAAERCTLGTGLLYDRMCPGGGWNCGNPRVYGVAGEPLTLPTAWALIALRHMPADEKKTASLAWLERNHSSIFTSASAAVARLALESYGVKLPRLSHSLPDLFDVKGFLHSTQVVAWAALALSPSRKWLPPVEPRS